MAREDFARGWTALGNDGTASVALHLASDYLLAPPLATTVVEAETTTNAQGSWNAAIATFR